MNNYKKNLLFFLIFTLLSLSVIAQQNNSLKMRLDSLPHVILSENIEYDLIAKTIMIKSEDPVLCHRTKSVEPANLKVNVVDPNATGIDVLLNENITHDVSLNVVNVNVSNKDNVCVTQKGANFGDLIFRDGFIPGLGYELSVNHVEPGDVLDYKIRITNENSGLVFFDFVEYVQETGEAFFEDTQDAPWTSCYIVSNGSSNPCPSGFTIDNGRKILNAKLFNGQALEISARRTVDVNSQIGQSIDFLSAIFYKDTQFLKEFSDVQYKYQTVEVINNNQPVIEWSYSNPILIYEDDVQNPVELTFYITDSTAADFMSQDLSYAISSLTNKLNISTPQISEINSSLFEVTFEISPQTDKFTMPNDPETVRVQVADALGTYSNVLELGVNITPVNDAPSFNVSCSHIVIDPTPPVGENMVRCEVSTNSCGIGLNGNFIADDFFCNVSPGPYEVDQTVSFSIVDNLIGGSNPNVIDTSFLGGITAHSNLSDLLIFTNDNEIGTATFRLIATDDDQNPLSSVPSPEVTVEVKPISYAITGNVVEFPSSNPPATYVMNLFVFDYFGQTGTYDYIESVTISADNGNTNTFLFDTRLEDGMDFYVEQGGFTNAGSNCSIDPQGNQAGGQPPRHQEVVNGSDVNVVVDCSQ